LAQDDLKKMIAYASVSHMGYVLIGLASGTPEGFAGAVYQMVSHGLLSALLFMLAGYVQEQTGTRSIASLSGLYHAMPQFTTVVSLVFFASLGMPGFSAFVAEFLVFVGAFSAATSPSGLYGIAIPILALIGLVAGAGYFLWALQRMFFGTYWHAAGHPASDSKEPDLLHKLMWYPLLLFSVLAGIFPSFWLEGLGPVAEWFAQVLQAGILR
jgi:NADH-quinone oxidoreductase subunit M